jgi:riboflavin synthase
MFTGIVEERGTVSRVGERLVVRCEHVLDDSDAGASLAVNGVCLTVVERGDETLSFDLSPETLSRSSLGRLRDGDPVNLERPVTLLSRLGGHLVQGHVDSVGTIARVAADGAGGSVLAVRIPGDLRPYVVEKGSVAVDGISLTAARLTEEGFEVALVPFTLRATTLGTARPGDPVNVEVDVIARYVESLTRRSG